MDIPVPTLPPTIMEVENGCISHISFLSFRTFFPLPWESPGRDLCGYTTYILEGSMSRAVGDGEIAKRSGQAMKPSNMSEEEPPWKPCWKKGRFGQQRNTPFFFHANFCVQPDRFKQIDALNSGSLRPEDKFQTTKISSTRFSW